MSGCLELRIGAVVGGDGHAVAIGIHEISEAGAILRALPQHNEEPSS
jgi:hypothetical protein